MTTYRSGSFRRLAKSFGPFATGAVTGLLRHETPLPYAPALPAGAAVGTVLARRNVEPVGLPQQVAAQRIHFVSVDAHGRRHVGSAVHYRTRHNGPLIAFAPSTYGVAPHCDPSHAAEVGVHWHNRHDLIAAYEQPVIHWFLHAGADVIAIDYPRDPVTQIQLYCDHQSAALTLSHAVAAARQLGSAGQLGLWGYSQGGGATAAYVEDRLDERPRAAVVGAPPSDLLDVARHVDGSSITSVIGYTIAGLMATSPTIRQEIDDTLSDYGKEKLSRILSTCVIGTIRDSGWRSTRRWTRSGRRVTDVLESLPHTAAEIERRRLGKRDVDAPVRLWASRHDDIIPFPMLSRLHDAWPSANWEIRPLFQVYGRTAVNHFVPYFQGFTRDAQWLLQQVST
ncbi:lipase family protein [Corynebacterium uterequi]|uniref:Secretory lipase n=1 Tax=Corynebacterium uterequi TaxID=1072256 RepID=A0A0G3HGK4_9CORY|nr:lipase family protein [Corynebacterium uterequi]AKK11073.1 Secretory lipase [Corynebacterium uterequi]